MYQLRGEDRLATGRGRRHGTTGALGGVCSRRRLQEASIGSNVVRGQRQCLRQLAERAARLGKALLVTRALAHPVPPTQGNKSSADVEDNAEVEQKTLVEFVVPEYVTRFGQVLKVIGSCEELGLWNEQNATPMTWNEGHKWTVSAAIPVGDLEFKIVVVDDDTVHWEIGNNRHVEVSLAEKVVVDCPFGETDKTEVVYYELEPQREGTLPPVASTGPPSPPPPSPPATVTANGVYMGDLVRDTAFKVHINGHQRPPTPQSEMAPSVVEFQELAAAEEEILRALEAHQERDQGEGEAAPRGLQAQDAQQVGPLALEGSRSGLPAPGTLDAVQQLIDQTVERLEADEEEEEEVVDQSTVAAVAAVKTVVEQLEQVIQQAATEQAAVDPAVEAVAEQLEQIKSELAQIDEQVAAFVARTSMAIAAVAEQMEPREEEGTSTNMDVAGVAELLASTPLPTRSTTSVPPQFSPLQLSLSESPVIFEGKELSDMPTVDLTLGPQQLGMFDSEDLREVCRLARMEVPQWATKGEVIELLVAQRLNWGILSPRLATQLQQKIEALQDAVTSRKDSKTQVLESTRTLEAAPGVEVPQAAPVPVAAPVAKVPAGVEVLSAADLVVLKADDLRQLCRHKGVVLGRDTTKTIMVDGLIAAGVTSADLSKFMWMAVQTARQLPGVGARSEQGLSGSDGRGREQVADSLKEQVRRQSPARDVVQPTGPVASQAVFSPTAQLPGGNQTYVGKDAGVLTVDILDWFNRNELWALCQLKGLALQPSEAKSVFVGHLLALPLTLEDLPRSLLVDMCMGMGVPVAKEAQLMRELLKQMMAHNKQVAPVAAEPQGAVLKPHAVDKAVESNGKTGRESSFQPVSEAPSSSAVFSELMALPGHDLADMCRKMGVEVPRNGGKADLVKQLISKGLTKGSLNKASNGAVAPSKASKAAAMVQDIRPPTARAEVPKAAPVAPFRPSGQPAPSDRPTASGPPDQPCYSRLNAEQLEVVKVDELMALKTKFGLTVPREAGRAQLVQHICAAGVSLGDLPRDAQQRVVAKSSKMGSSPVVQSGAVTSLSTPGIHASGLRRTSTADVASPRPSSATQGPAVKVPSTDVLGQDVLMQLKVDDITQLMRKKGLAVRPGAVKADLCRTLAANHVKLEDLPRGVAKELAQRIGQGAAPAARSPSAPPRVQVAPSVPTTAPSKAISASPMPTPPPPRPVTTPLVATMQPSAPTAPAAPPASSASGVLSREGLSSLRVDDLVELCRKKAITLGRHLTQKSDLVDRLVKAGVKEEDLTRGMRQSLPAQGGQLSSPAIGKSPGAVLSAAPPSEASLPPSVAVTPAPAVSVGPPAEQGPKDTQTPLSLVEASRMKVDDLMQLCRKKGLQVARSWGRPDLVIALVNSGLTRADLTKEMLQAIGAGASQMVDQHPKLPASSSVAHLSVEIQSSAKLEVKEEPTLTVSLTAGAASRSVPAGQPGSFDRAHLLTLKSDELVALCKLKGVAVPRVGGKEDLIRLLLQKEGQAVGGPRGDMPALSWPTPAAPVAHSTPKSVPSPPSTEASGAIHQEHRSGALRETEVKLLRADDLRDLSRIKGVTVSRSTTRQDLVSALVRAGLVWGDLSKDMVRHLEAMAPRTVSTQEIKGTPAAVSTLLAPSPSELTVKAPKMMTPRPAASNNLVGSSAVQPAVRGEGDASVPSSFLATLKVDDLTDICRKVGVSLGRNATRQSLVDSLVSKGITCNQLPKFLQKQLTTLKDGDVAKGGDVAKSSQHEARRGTTTSQLSAVPSPIEAKVNSEPQPLGAPTGAVEAQLLSLRQDDLVALCKKNGVAIGRNSTRKSLVQELLTTGVLKKDLPSTTSSASPVPVPSPATFSPPASVQQSLSSPPPVPSPAPGVASLYLTQQQLLQLKADDLLEICRLKRVEVPRGAGRRELVQCLEKVGVRLVDLKKSMITLLDIDQEQVSPVESKPPAVSTPNNSSTPAMVRAPLASEPPVASPLSPSTQEVQRVDLLSGLNRLRVDEVVELCRKRGVPVGRGAVKADLVKSLVSGGLTEADLPRALQRELALPLTVQTTGSSSTTASSSYERALKVECNDRSGSSKGPQSSGAHTTSLPLGDLLAGAQSDDLVELCRRKGVSVRRMASKSELVRDLLAAGLAMEDLPPYMRGNRALPSTGRTVLAIPEAKVDTYKADSRHPDEGLQRPAPGHTSFQAQPTRVAHAGGHLPSSAISLFPMSELLELSKVKGVTIPSAGLTRSTLSSALHEAGLGINDLSKKHLVDLCLKLGLSWSGTEDQLRQAVTESLGLEAASAPAPVQPISDRELKAEAASGQPVPTANMERLPVHGNFLECSSSNGVVSLPLSSNDLTSLQVHDLVELCRKVGLEVPRNGSKADLVKQLVKKGLTFKDLTPTMQTTLQARSQTLTTAADRLKTMVKAVNSHVATEGISASAAPTAQRTLEVLAEEYLTAKELESFKVDDLTVLCKKKGVQPSRMSSKSQLAAMLVEVGVALTDLSKGLLVDMCLRLGQPATGAVDALVERVRMMRPKSAFVF